MTDQPKLCPLCGSEPFAWMSYDEFRLCRCKNETCTLGHHSIRLSLIAWDSIPRPSESAEELASDIEQRYSSNMSDGFACILTETALRWAARVRNLASHCLVCNSTGLVQSPPPLRSMKPCPLCGEPAKKITSSLGTQNCASCSNDQCEMSETELSEYAWQSLPRPSEDAEALAVEIATHTDQPKPKCNKIDCERTRSIVVRITTDYEPEFFGSCRDRIGVAIAVLSELEKEYSDD